MSAADGYIQAGLWLLLNYLQLLHIYDNIQVKILGEGAVRLHEV